MNKFKFFDIAFESFYSKKLYKDVYFNWSKYALSYLLFLVILSVIPSALNIHSFISKINIEKIQNIENYEEIDKTNINSIIKGIISQLPVINITNGTAASENKEPTNIYYPGSNKIIGIIDTYGTINSLENRDANFLLTKDFITTKFSASNKSDIYQEYSIHELFQHNNLLLNQDTILYLFSEIKKISGKIFWFLYLPLIILFSFLFNILFTIFFIALGKIYLKFSKVKTNFKNLYRLAVVSGTPATVIYLVISLTTKNDFIINHLSYWIILTASVMYFFFAIKAVSEEKENLYRI